MFSAESLPTKKKEEPTKEETKVSKKELAPIFRKISRRNPAPRDSFFDHVAETDWDDDPEPAEVTLHKHFSQSEGALHTLRIEDMAGFLPAAIRGNMKAAVTPPNSLVNSNLKLNAKSASTHNLAKIHKKAKKKKQKDGCVIC